MKPILFLITSFVFTICSLQLSAQISGFVYRDFNGTGTKDSTAVFYEPGVQGITVTATLANNNVFSTTTDGTGAYSFTSGQVAAGAAARIEFSGLAKGDHAGFNGSGNGSNIQFATAPSSTASFAINAPEDYWNNISNPDPVLMMVQQPRGTYTGYNAGRYSVLQINNSTNGPNPSTSAYYMTIDTSKRPAKFFNTGTIFGMAYQKKQERFFVSSSLKRTYGLGLYGIGGVYFLNKSGSTWVFSGGFNMQGVTPSNSATALDFGAVTRVAAPDTANDNFLSAVVSGTVKSRDIDAFAKVGTMGFGGIKADQNSDSIYMINMYQKSLIVMDASAAGSTLNNASAATLGAFTRAYDLASLPGFPVATGAGNNIRPYGIKIYKGRGYIGVVSDAMATQLTADLKGYVISFDVKNLAAGFTKEVTIDFDLFSGTVLRAPRAWVTTWAQAGGTATTNPKFCSQPMIADIEFNEDGSMVIGIRDRWGDQNSMDYDASPGSVNAGLSIQQGDILHACKVGSGWVLEGTSASCIQPITQGDPKVAPYNEGGFGNSYNKTGKEYYADVSGDGENESAEGTLAKLMGSRQVATSVYDPIADTVQPNGNYWYSQGLQWNDVITGKKKQMCRTTIINTIQVSKSNGIGDIEFVTENQPVQIGNLVWNDGNGNGIQDAGETGINAVAVILRNPGLDGIYNTADDQTWTTTTNSNGNYIFDFSNMAATDTRKPATWTGVKGILPGYNYRLEIDTSQVALTGYHLSAANVSGGTLGTIDNDGNLSGKYALAIVNTSFITQDVDFGFKNLTSIGDRIWADDNIDGLLNPGEGGVANITITLYNSSGTVIATSTTDSTGFYTLSNIPAGSGYYVIFTNLPPGASFTQQNIGGGGATNNSKPDYTGKTASFSIAAGQIITNMDAGLKGITVIVLPVKIEDFMAVKNGSNVTLSWKISDNPGIRTIEIQRAADGVDFTHLLNIASANGTSAAQDLQPINGKNFYRLKIVNKDGTEQYSNISTVVFEVKTGLLIYPNPAKNMLQVELPEALVNRQTTFIITNQLGQEMIKKQLISSRLQKIDISKLSGGFYLLTIKQANQLVESKKIQILR